MDISSWIHLSRSRMPDSDGRGAGLAWRDPVQALPIPFRINITDGLFEIRALRAEVDFTLGGDRRVGSDGEEEEQPSFSLPPCYDGCSDYAG